MHFLSKCKCNSFSKTEHGHIAQSCIWFTWTLDFGAANREFSIRFWLLMCKAVVMLRENLWKRRSLAAKVCASELLFKGIPWFTSATGKGLPFCYLLLSKNWGWIWSLCMEMPMFYPALWPCPKLFIESCLIIIPCSVHRGIGNMLVCCALSNCEPWTHFQQLVATLLATLHSTITHC